MASFDVTSPVQLVERTRLGRLAINGKSKMAERGQVGAKCPTLAQKKATTFRFYHLQ